MKFAIAATTAFLAVVMTAHAQTAEDLIKTVEENAQVYGIIQHCSWGGIDGVVLGPALKDEAIAQLAAFAPAMLAQGQARADKAESAGRAVACTGPAAMDIRRGLRIQLIQKLADVASLVWLRADAFLAEEARVPYGGRMTTLSSSRALIAQHVAEIEAKSNPQTVAQVRAQMKSVAVSTLAIVCADRKKERWSKGERPCPVIPDSTIAQRPYARVLLATAENYVATIAADSQATGGAPSPGP